MVEKTKKAAIYARVSTDDQTVQNQVEVLTQVAERRGWVIVAIYKDEGISGAKGREKRPGLNNLLNDAQRRNFDIVMAWAIDRIGRSLIDLLTTIQHLESCGIDLYLDQQNIDTTTPTGKLLYQVTGAFAEFERTMIRQRVKASLNVIKAKIQRKGNFTTKAGIVRAKLGRPGAETDKLEEAKKLLSQGMGINKVAKRLRLGNHTVAQVRKSVQVPT
jgi:DNA invertase Pin-like site-specific DNA recombinase